MDNIQVPKKEELGDCTALILCKKELFFQTDKGETLFTWYPVGIEAAKVISLYYDIPMREE